MKENAPQNDIPDTDPDAVSIWDEIPRCFGYAIGAIAGAAFMGFLLGYSYYALFN